MVSFYQDLSTENHGHQGTEPGFPMFYRRHSQRSFCQIFWADLKKVNILGTFFGTWTMLNQDIQNLTFLALKAPRKKYC